MFHTLKQKVSTQIITFSKAYFKTKPADCILYSKDNTEFKIHRELLGQTEFMREILKTVKDHCFSKIEILCPCTKEELTKIIHFLYFGEIQCDDVFDLINISEDLNKIFGFPESLNLDDQVPSLLDHPTLPSIIDLTNFDLDTEIIESMPDEMNIYVDISKEPP